MNYPMPKTKEEEKMYDRMEYELEKEGTIAVFEENNWDLDKVGINLINSMRSEDVISWVKEDGYTVDENEIFYFFVHGIAVPKRSAPERIQDMYCKDYGWTRDELLKYQIELEKSKK